jgi:nucleoside-diphosphate-sugar epimerase
METAKRRVHELFYRRRMRKLVRRMSELALPSEDLAFPKDSLILVTGATGFIGSHIVQEALAFGFCVRAVVRSQAKADLLQQALTGSDLTTCIVPDFDDAAALDKAVSGCAGIIHPAADTTLDPDPQKVIPPAVATTLAVLEAAKRSSTCRRVVITSSASAVTLPKPGKSFKVDSSTWNDESPKRAQASAPPHNPDDFYHVYAASKILSEKAALDFMSTKSPSFSLNVVVPNTNLGRVLLRPATSSARFIPAIIAGRLMPLPPHWMINVDDAAKVHFAALVDSTVMNQRILAWGQRFAWNDVLMLVKAHRPHLSTLPDPLPDMGQDELEVDNALARDLLRRWFNQADFKTLEESVRENLEGYAEEEGEKTR